MTWTINGQSSYVTYTKGMPAHDPRNLCSLHETMRTLRPQKKLRARGIGVSLLALGLATSVSLALISGALSSEQRLASVRENLTATAASVPPLMDSAVSSIYRTLCPIFTDCEVAQIASTATATVKTSRPVRRVLGPASSTASIPQGATTGPAQSATPESAASPHTTVIERIVERVLPSYSLANAGGITEDVLNDRLNQLDNKLSSQIFSLSASLTSIPNSLPSSGGLVNNIALSQRIDNLSGTTITGATITGGSISGTSIAGTITNAIDAALGTIATLSGTELSYAHATFTSATTTNLIATNATTSNLAVTGTATSRPPARPRPATSSRPLRPPPSCRTQARRRSPPETSIRPPSGVPRSPPAPAPTTSSSTTPPPASSPAAMT